LSDFPRTGLLFNLAFAPWLDQAPDAVACLEIPAFHLFSISRKVVDALSHRCPTIVSNGRLSIGTPGPLDSERLRSLAAIVQGADPLWLSEPLCFSRTPEHNLVFPLPLSPGAGALNTIVDHATQVMDACRKPLLLENTASFLRPRSPMRETDFINQACSKANCGLLLDVTALLVNARNHRFDPVRWLRQIDPALILQLHVSGYTLHDDGSITDDHLHAVQDDVWDLAAEALSYSRPRAVILERTGNYPPVFEMERDLARARTLAGRASPRVAS
jgi:uncharacterized protein (UPF0276 family)